MTDSLDKIPEPARQNVKQWLENSFDEKTKEEIHHLLKTNPQALTDAFFKKLHFGTAGIRGIMGAGTNRLNFYTIRGAAEGLAQYIDEQKQKQPSVVIGFDNRHLSKEFAEQTARVLAQHQIKTYIFQELRPTPFISFCCRHLKCIAAVMITASHNPPEYNGFKVYWSDGGQVLPPHDQKIIEKVNALQKLEKILLAPKEDPLIHWIGEEYDQIYLDKNLALWPFKREKKDLSILYTNLHGAGLTLIPKALNQWGYEKLFYVEKQTSFDGDFPYAKKPNPEEDQAMSLGKEQMEKEQLDLFLASDPDSDRIGTFALHDKKGVRITGNEIACLCLYYLCKKCKPESTSYCVKTIVTTELFARIAESFGLKCKDVLTGFKYIAEKIQEDAKGFFFGAEESCGYLFKTNARDKDAVITASIIAEMAQEQKDKNQTLVDLLYEIYQKYGVYREHLTSIHFEETEEGMKTMQKVMQNMRDKQIDHIDSYPVKIAEDYFLRQKKQGSSLTKLTLPKSDVLRYFLEDETKIVIRPSGTEPKIKIYIGIKQTEGTSLSEKIDSCDKKLLKLTEEIKKLLSIEE